MVCKNCGCKIPDGASVCRVCGGSERVESRPTPQMSPAFFKAPDLGGPSVATPTPAPVATPVAPAPVPAPVAPVAAPVAPAPVENPIVIDTPAPGKTCPDCGKVLDVTAKFCNGCGKKLSAPVAEPVFEMPMVAPVGDFMPPAATKTCPTCGNVLPAEARFCNGCGSDLSGAAPAVSVTDPVVTTATKKAKKVKVKKAKSAKSGKGLIIGIVAVALAIVIGLGAWLLIADPFDWFGGSGGDKEEDETNSAVTSGMTSEEVAQKYADLSMKNDAEGIVSMIPDSILSGSIVGMNRGYSASDKAAYTKDLGKDLEYQNSGYGEGFTYTIDTPVAFPYNDAQKEDIMSQYRTLYNLEVTDYIQYTVPISIHTGSNSVRSKQITINLLKVGDSWVVADVPWIIGGWESSNEGESPLEPNPGTERPYFTIPTELADSIIDRAA